MRLFEQQHTEPRLPDAAADRERQFAVKQRLVEGQRCPLLAMRLPKLRPKRRRIYTHAHAGDLQRAVQHGVVKQDVTVQLPVVIVRRAPVMRFAVGKLAADLLDEYGAVFLCIEILALARRLAGVQADELLARDTADLAAERQRQHGVFRLHDRLRITDRLHDGARRPLKIGKRALFPCDDLLPVPLIHIDRMEIVERLVAANGVHVRIQSAPLAEAIPVQRIALPLCERVNDLRFRSDSRNVKRYGALIAVQIVVQTIRGIDEQRR